MHSLEWFITFIKWQQKQFTTRSTNHCMITNHFLIIVNVYVYVYMYVTLKSGILLCHHSNKLHFKIYNNAVILNCYNRPISQYYCKFDQINASLMNIKRIFKNI